MVKLALHKEEKKINNYDEMIMAASFMEEAINELQDYKDKDLGIIFDYDFIEEKSFGYKLLGGIDSTLVDALIDENGRNNFNSKLSALNPDLAAVITNEFISLGLDSTSVAAISFTGSYPGANIAVLSACKTLGINTMVISSNNASKFGATDTLFFWLDMQSKLVELDIFQIYFDLYDDTFIAEKRIELYEKNTNDIDIYINVGWPSKNPKSEGIRDAINEKKKKDDIYSTIWIDRSQLKEELDYKFDFEDLDNEVFYKFLDKNIQIFNIDNMKHIADVYDLPFPHKGSIGNKLGKTNSIYTIEGRYNRSIVIMAIVLSILNIIIVGVYSYKEMNKRMLSSDPETIL